MSITYGVVMIEDNDLDTEEEVVDNSPQKRKKIMVLLLALLIVIGISVGIYFALNTSYDSLGRGYKIIQYDKDADKSVTVFYDLPEIKTSVRGKDGQHELKMKITLELSSIEDLKLVEILIPRLNDVVIAHTIELNLDEVKGSEGLYWLKEELLYRFNLAAAPVKIKNLNFSVFELQ